MTGANGRNGSRNFTAAFSRPVTSGRSGDARIDRLPSARGPASSLPWNSPAIFPAASWAARYRAGSADLPCRQAGRGTVAGVNSG